MKNGPPQELQSVRTVEVRDMGAMAWIRERVC
jgi:hypothetical protein